MSGSRSIDAIVFAIGICERVRGTPSAVSFQPDHMRQMATTEGSATKSESGVSAAAKNSGAAAVPSEAPTSGAEQSAAVSVLRRGCRR